MIDLPDPVPDAEGVLEFVGADKGVHVVCAASAKEALEARAACGVDGCQTAYEVASDVPCGKHETRPAALKSCCG